ncbi:26S proteasome regulatory complex component [Giardia duodenalis]|uniref:26S proteasome regulatory complex component n=1 Tax=Giardia intestinalis (strain ATCC 50803 / WB clone C6) TaxID=184922 RepID=A8BQ17_GIAIC|nr:26S proteasome regulatory complex component [Giardia intestinalis]KAE8304089.1 26S proteasome regulatory complex component [Giardia intestinalis]|eukprot:XP_001705567.1 Hypothetical protein GL50803_16659 [Giardia lamblia ATCC 50803]
MATSAVTTTACPGEDLLTELTSGVLLDVDVGHKWSELSTSIAPELVEKALPVLLATTPSPALPVVRIASLAQEIIAHYLAETVDYSTTVHLQEQLEKWGRQHNLEFVSTRAVQDQVDGLLRMENMHTWVKAASMIDSLITEARGRDPSAALIRTHLLAAETFTRIKHYSKARSYMMSARAMNIKLSPEMHARMDAVSGCVCICSDDYAGAAGYYQEASNLGYPCVSQLLLVKTLQRRFFEVDAVLQNRRKYATPEKIARFPQWMVDADNAILPKIRKLGILLDGKLNKLLLEQLNTLVDEVLAVKNAAFEVYTVIQIIRRSETLNFILKMLRPYKRVELSHVSGFINMSEEEAKEYLSQLIINGDLPFVIEEGAGTLIRIERERTSNTEFIEEATKAVDLASALLTSCISKSNI